MKSHFENITIKALACFWCTVAIALAIMAMLRVNSLIHIYSPTPHRVEMEVTK